MDDNKKNDTSNNNVLGKLRQYRLFGIAIFDITTAILGFYILDILVNKKFTELYGYKYYVSIIPIGVIVHLLLQQKTYLNTQLFSHELNFNSIIIKLFVLVCLYYIFFNMF